MTHSLLRAVAKRHNLPAEAVAEAEAQIAKKRQQTGQTAPGGATLREIVAKRFGLTLDADGQIAAAAPVTSDTPRAEGLFAAIEKRHGVNRNGEPVAVAKVMSAPTLAAALPASPEEHPLHRAIRRQHRHVEQAREQAKQWGGIVEHANSTRGGK